ncbi:hypothetical protein [Streptomyces erythrochromogenes]|uniref:hypothetical protein n=1 Tax=Streptomyces erythrochromogenes TaxID=285574 RepID=UPI0037D4AA6C
MRGARRRHRPRVRRYHLHDITATATEQGDAELAHAVAVERITWEKRGLLTPIAARGVLAWPCTAC